jgi:hypothetical protein
MNRLRKAPGLNALPAYVLIAATLVALATLAARAQQRPGPATPQGTGLLLGQVVDADSGKGVSGVIVTLGASAPAPSVISELADIGVTPAATGRRMLTSSDGRFLFRDLPKGRYALTTSAPGYVPASYGQGRPSGPGQPIDLDEAQRLGGVTVRAWKYAAISGGVVDEAGEPAVGVSVRCLRRVIAGGHLRFDSANSGVTDDRGMYRSANLIPGDYVCGTVANQVTMPVSVADMSDAASRSGNPNSSAAYRTMQDSGGRGDSSGLRVGDFVIRPSGVGSRGLPPPAPAANGRMMMYPTQYFPSAMTTTQASLITLKSGEDHGGVDLQLKLLPSVRVSGTVTGPSGPAGFLGMTLIPSSGSDLISEGQAEAARTVSDAAGAFTFLGIPPGQYVVKIRMYPRVVAAAPGTSIDAVPSVVDISSMPAGSGLMGRGAPPPPPPADPGLWAQMPVTVGDADLSDLNVVLRAGLRVSGRVEFAGTRAAPSADSIQRMVIRMQSAEGRTSSPIPAEGRAAPDGTFRTAGYQAGNYIASVVPISIPAGWTLKSVTSGGKDVSVDPLELTDKDVSDVVMTFTDQTTELSGTVTTSANAPDATASVIAFPADSQAWKEIGVVARRWRYERVAKAGTFTVAGLPAGEYFVAAVANNAAGDPRDPKYLETLVRTATRVSLGDGEKKHVDVKSVR